MLIKIIILAIGFIVLAYLVGYFMGSRNKEKLIELDYKQDFKRRFGD